MWQDPPGATCRWAMSRSAKATMLRKMHSSRCTWTQMFKRAAPATVQVLVQTLDAVYQRPEITSSLEKLYSSRSLKSSLREEVTRFLVSQHTPWPVEHPKTDHNVCLFLVYRASKRAAVFCDQKACRVEHADRQSGTQKRREFVDCLLGAMCDAIAHERLRYLKIALNVRLLPAFYMYQLLLSNHP